MGRIKALPSYSLLAFNHYTGHESLVADLIGGKVERNLKDPKQTSYKDTCAIRISRALNLSNQPIIKMPAIRVNSGENKKGLKGKIWYIYSVVDMKRYLELVYGTPDVKFQGKKGSLTKEKLKGKPKGIILFTGIHVDLWDGTSCNHHNESFVDATEILIWATPKESGNKDR